MKPLISLICMVAVILGNAQPPNWQWAKSAGGSSDDAGYSVATDASGNSYMVGFFCSPSITFGSTTLIKAGDCDMFIVKYDPNGNALWAKSAGGTSFDYASAVATDAFGNIYVAGNFQSTSITFGSTILIPNLTGPGNIFLVKYDANGNVLWAKNDGGTGVHSIAIDANGNVLATGDFYGSSVTFGSITLTNTDIYHIDMFIVKYDASGNVLWAKNEGGVYNEYGKSVALDVNGNILVTGEFNSPTLAFGSAILNNPWGYPDIFIVKYDPSGNVLWAQSAGGPGNDVSESIAIDVNGNFFITGEFNGYLTFGSTTLNSVGVTDMFLVKYDASGNVLWAKSEGGPNYEYAESVAIDAIGNILVTGWFVNSTLTFGSTTLTNAGWSDIFIVKYDPLGNVLWAKSAGGNDYDYAKSVASDANGNVLVVGYFHSQTLAFGSTTLINATFNDSADIFIAKLSALTGLKNSENKDDFFVYPNPFTSQTTLKISGVEQMRNARLKIFDIYGKEERNISVISSPEIIIERGNLSNGIYFYEFMCEKEIFGKGKMIIQ